MEKLEYIQLACKELSGQMMNKQENQQVVNIIVNKKIVRLKYIYFLYFKSVIKIVSSVSKSQWGIRTGLVRHVKE